MEIKVTTSEIKKFGILSKITLALFGVFLTSLIFAFSIQALAEIGIWVALAVCLGLIFCGFYFIKAGTRLRFISWSMLITIILGSIAFVAGLSLLSKSLNEIL